VNALRLYYLTVYLALGAVFPLVALALSARGLRPSQYAWLLMLMPLSRLLSPPLWGALADKHFGPRKLVRINTWVAGLAMLGLAFARGLWPTAICFAVWAFFSSSLVPLVEAGTYQMLGARAASFGYVRVFGSIGFALSALGVGFSKLDPGMVTPFVGASLGYLAAGLVSRKLSEYAIISRASLRPAVLALLRRRDVLLLWLGSMLYYAAHGIFDMYFGPFARTLPGVRTELVSMAWGLGVVAEVIVFFFVPRWLSGRLMRWLLPGSALVAALRWWLTAQVTSASQVLMLQPLHAITFGVWYLAFVHENQAEAPAHMRATVQGIAVACLGMGTMSAIVVGGYGLERFGGRPLFMMASLASLGSLMLYLVRIAVRSAAAQARAVLEPP